MGDFVHDSASDIGVNFRPPPPKYIGVSILGGPPFPYYPLVCFHWRDMHAT
jgi:hypothetical protein